MYMASTNRSFPHPFSYIVLPTIESAAAKSAAKSTVADIVASSAAQTAMSAAASVGTASKLVVSTTQDPVTSLITIVKFHERNKNVEL